MQQSTTSDLYPLQYMDIQSILSHAHPTSHSQHYMPSTILHIMIMGTNMLLTDNMIPAAVLSITIDTELIRMHPEFTTARSKSNIYHLCDFEE